MVFRVITLGMDGVNPIRDLTKEANKLADSAHDLEVSERDQLHNATLIIEQGKQDASNGFLLIASALALVKRERLWTVSYQSFDEYCTSVNMKRSTAYKLAQIWDRWGDKARGIQFDRLAKLLPVKIENEDEVLEQAKELNPGAFLDRVRELRGQMPSDSIGCNHQYFTRCRLCGAKA